MTQTIATGTNRHFSHIQKTQASREAIWHLWTDVSTWKYWDKGLKDATLDGEFIDGAIGTIIPLSGPKAKFEVTDYREGEGYTIVTKLPLGKLYVKRSFDDGEMTILCHEVWFGGLLPGVWARILGPEFRVSLLTTMQVLVDMAEGKSLK